MGPGWPMMTVVAEVEAAVAEAAVVAPPALERCMTQPAQSAGPRPRCLSGPPKVAPCTAAIASSNNRAVSQAHA